MKRTILYYPTISVPNGGWLRQALFYFDEIASIVPRQVYFSGEVGDLLVPVTPEVEFLRAEKVFRAIPPEVLTFGEHGWPVAHKFGAEFLAAVEDEGLAAEAGMKFVRVHRAKFTGTFLESLERKKLVRYDAPSGRFHEAEWFLVEERTAKLFMSMLAQYLADLDSEVTVPGTDRVEYESRVYRAREPEKGFGCIETYMRAVLPCPGPDVPLPKILEFKRKREAEVLRYRERIDSLQKELSDATGHAEVRQALVQFDEAQRRELKDLIDALKDSRIATIWGSVKTLIKVNSPTFLGGMAVAGGLAAGIDKIPITGLLGGMVLSGAIEVGSYLADHHSEKRAMERKSPFAYVHHARAAGIV
jgi:hypothetical protein